MSRFTRRSLFAVVAATALALVFDARTRANAPAGRFTIGTGASAGTVFDTKTKLTWQRSQPTTLMTWTAAKTYCPGLGSTLAGTGWRLPTKKELLTLLDYSQTTLLIDPVVFPGIPTGTNGTVFWSSTPVVGSSTNAWAVVFNIGNSESDDATITFGVRCVR